MKRTFFAFAALSFLALATVSPASPQALPKKAGLSHKNPVVLIPGFMDSPSRMQTMAGYLRKQGWTVYTPALKPTSGQVGIDELARQLSVFVAVTFHPGEKFDLVGYSMGGLISRYYLQRLGGLPRVDHLVTLGAPHNGSALANLLANPGCRQMRPGSDFLKNLNRDSDSLSTIKFTSIWSPMDMSILPSESSLMPQAHNVRVIVAMHPLLISQKSCLVIVADALRS